jgi:hypothetical protein
LKSGVIEIAVVGQQSHGTTFLWTGRISAKLVGALHGLPLFDGGGLLGHVLTDHQPRTA